MSNDKRRDPGINAIELTQLLGGAPVLSTESVEGFEMVFDQLIAALKPQDMLERILIWEFAVPSWEINRYTRHRSLSFDRSFKQSLDFQAQRIKSQNARKQDLRDRLSGQLAQTPADIAQLTQLERKLENSATEIAEILKRTPSELDHCHALEKSIAFHKDVEFLIASISKRRNEALQMLDLYRAGLGKRVNEAMNDVLDAEYKLVEEHPQQVKSPSLVPRSAAPPHQDHGHSTGTTAIPAGSAQETK
jgi:hypothetical protein